MDPVELHRRAVAEFDIRVRDIADDQWERPTPCSDWNVHELLNHLVNEDRWTKPLIDGKTIDDVGTALDGDLLGTDPKGAWQDASHEALASVQGVAGELQRKVNVSWGQIPAEEYITQLWTDHLIHAWDLARGTGGDDKLDPELVDVCYEVWSEQEDFLKSTGVYGGKVVPPEGADTQTKLLAVFGRTS